MKYEIWMEGYAVTGNQSDAQMIGEYEADSFDEAVEKLNQEAVEKYGKVSAVKGGLLDSETTKPIDNWTIWGCRLFDNEVDARKSFG